MRTVIFTRTGFHHTSFINRLQERFEITCVVREAYPEHTGKDSWLSVGKNLFGKNLVQRIQDKRFLDQFLKTYSAGFRYHTILKDYLRADFDLMLEQPGTKYLNIGCGEINSPELREVITSFKPDVIVVLGSSVLKPEMISLPAAAIINLHSGLSPYYRGTWSYGWPVVNKDPEHIGVTVHSINSGIDTGDIIYQTKPLLEKDDDLNTIFLKVIAEGIELMVKALEEIINGHVEFHKQPCNTGRLYQTKDFDAGAARACLENLADGLIEAYLSCKKERDSRVKLFGYVPPQLFR